MGKITGTFKRIKHAARKLAAKTAKGIGYGVSGWGFLQDGLAYLQPLEKAGATATIAAAPTLGKIGNFGLQGLGALTGTSNLTDKIGRNLENYANRATEQYKIEMESRQNDLLLEGNLWKTLGSGLRALGDILEPDEFDIIFANAYYEKSELINDKSINKKYQFAEIFSKYHNNRVRIQYPKDDIWKCKCTIKDDSTLVHIPSFDRKVRIDFIPTVTNIDPTFSEERMLSTISYYDPRTSQQKVVLFPGKVYKSCSIDNSGVLIDFN